MLAVDTASQASGFGTFVPSIRRSGTFQGVPVSSAIVSCAISDSALFSVGNVSTSLTSTK